MKNLILTLFLTSSSISQAQLTPDSWLYGTWIKQGYEFEGSFYPVNTWNSERLELNEDYSLLKTNAAVELSKVVLKDIKGKWSYDAIPHKIRFYGDDEIYSPQGKILLFNDDYKIDFQSNNYFTVLESKGNYVVSTRYQRDGTTETFEESENKEKLRMANLALNYDANSKVFYQVYSLNPAKRKPLYFDADLFDFEHSIYEENDSIERVDSYIIGSISDFNDSTITIRVYNENKEIYYKNGLESKIDNDYSYSKNGFVLCDYKLNNLEDVFPDRKFTKIAPLVLSLSAITALIVAPLISINFKNGDFNKSRYYKTAGIGLIGIGASIPLAYIFNKKKPIRFIPLSDPTAKNSWYLQKAPR